MPNPSNAKVADQDLVRRIEGASPAELHAMLLEAGEKFLGLAIAAMKMDDVAGKSRHFSRVSEIIVELSGRLNRETGGELAVNLARIYEGWIDALFDAGQKNEVDRLHLILKQMGEMRTTWEELCQTPVGIGEQRMVS